VYVDGVAAVSANGKSLLYFEQRRDKASPTIDGAAADEITDAAAQQLDVDDQLLHNGRQVRTYIIIARSSSSCYSWYVCTAMPPGFLLKATGAGIRSDLVFVVDAVCTTSC
jgi:hypothetical protein